MTTHAIVHTENEFQWWDSNGWKMISDCPLWMTSREARVCFVLWRFPRNENETPQVVARFNFKNYGK